MARPTFKHRALSYEIAPPLAWVNLGPPGSENQVDVPAAQDVRTAQEISEVAELLQHQSEVRVLLVTGPYGGFSRRRETVPIEVRESGGDAVMRWVSQRRAASTLASVPIPVVAAINGDAVDHGLELALACDFRIACYGAQLGVTDVGRGVVPWDGATQRLPRLIGRSRALDMLLSSRLVSAEEALEMGLVNAVVAPSDLHQTTRQLAEIIASGAPIASRYAKEAVLGAMDLPLEQGLRLEADLNILLHSTKDREEGIRSFLDKAVPKYQGE